MTTMKHEAWGLSASSREKSRESRRVSHGLLRSQDMKHVVYTLLTVHYHNNKLNYTRALLLDMLLSLSQSSVSSNSDRAS